MYIVGANPDHMRHFLLYGIKSSFFLDASSKFFESNFPFLLMQIPDSMEAKSYLT